MKNLLIASIIALVFALFVFSALLLDDQVAQGNKSAGYVKTSIFPFLNNK